MDQHQHSIYISASTKEERDRSLSEAEASLVKIAASNGGAGILITRHTLYDYTLTLTADVSYGQTREHSVV